MKDCNSADESKFTNVELAKLDGVETGVIIKWKSEINIVSDVNPLRISPIWDIG